MNARRVGFVRSLHHSASVNRLPTARHLVRARRGVTLMELIVALTVTALMAAVGTATFTSIIDNRHILRESTAATESASALRETIRQWMLPAIVRLPSAGAPRGSTANARVSTSNVATRTQNGAEGVTAAAVNGDELTFTTTAPNPTNSTNAIMRLFVDADESTPERGLTLEYQTSQQAPLQRRQLDSTIVGMTVEYLNQQNNQWVPTESATGIRVRAVRVTFIPADGVTVPPLMSLPITFLVSATATAAPTATPTR